jgi:hypothetical protein
MSVDGMFCKHEEGNKINQKRKKIYLMLCCGTFNCEFFQKSKVAVSELAGSVEENLRSLLDKNYKLINGKKLKHFIASIQPLLESLKPLEKGSGIKIEEKHIVQVLKEFFKDDNDTLDMINGAFIVGYSLNTQCQYKCL